MGAARRGPTRRWGASPRPSTRMRRRRSECRPTRSFSPTGPTRSDGAGTQARRQAGRADRARAGDGSEEHEGAGAVRHVEAGSGDLAGSIARWRELRAMLPSDSDDAREIDTRDRAARSATIESGRRRSDAGRCRTGAGYCRRTCSGGACFARRCGSFRITGRVELDPRSPRVSRRTIRCSSWRVRPKARGCRSRCSAFAPPSCRGRSGSTTRWHGAGDDDFDDAPRRRRSARVASPAMRSPQPGDLRGISAAVAPGATELRVRDRRGRPMSTLIVRHAPSARSRGTSAATRRLFRGVAFRVEAGRALLVTGANGSGKTTLLRILAGLTAPAAGDDPAGTASRSQPFDPRLREAVAFGGHLPALKDELTAQENLESLTALAGTSVPREQVARGARPRRARRESACCPRACCRRDSAGASASRGCAFCAPLWILDEPATALDADGTRTARRDAGANISVGGGTAWSRRISRSTAARPRCATLALDACAA